MEHVDGGPSETVHEELVAYVRRDESRLGQVYRLVTDGLTPEEVATTLGVSTSNFVWNYSKITSALLDRELPTAHTFAKATATRFRSIARDPHLSTETRTYIWSCIEELERRASVERQAVNPAPHSQTREFERPSAPMSGHRKSIRRSELMAAVEAVRAQIKSANLELSRIHDELKLLQSGTPSAMNEDRPAARWSSADAQDALREAATMAYPLSAAAYDQLRRENLVAGPSAAWIAATFNGWIAACDEVGVEAGRSSVMTAGSKWTDSELLAELLDFLAQNRGSTSTESYDQWARHREDAPSAGTIIGRFGTWANAKAFALRDEEAALDQMESTS
jgi:hypothetical protein